MLRNNILRPLAAGLVLSAGSVSCNTTSPNTNQPQCFGAGDCAPGSECSGGQCVPAPGCVSAEQCAEGQDCIASVCREFCTSDQVCAPRGLMCDLATSFCVPIPNPDPMAGVGGAMTSAGGAMTGQGGVAGTVMSGGAGGTPAAGAAGTAGVAGIGTGGNGAMGGGPSGGGGGNGGNAGTAGSGGNAGTAGSGNAGSGGVEIINTPGACQSTWGNQGNGSITFYTFDQGTAAAGDVHCSFGIQQGPDRVNHVHTGNGEFFGAMNTADYNTAAACGACVELRRDDGRSVQVTIVDECPIGSNDKCVSGHIDLSRAAFLQLAQESEGYVGQRAGLGSINWNYIPCPTQGNVRIRFVEPQNEFYDGIVVENHRYPIRSVEVWEEGRWVECQREAYNFWFTSDTDFSDDPPFYFRVTDMNGGVFTVQAPETPGSQDTGHTQMCQ